MRDGLGLLLVWVLAATACASCKEPSDETWIDLPPGPKVESAWQKVDAPYMMPEEPIFAVAWMEGQAFVRTFEDYESKIYRASKSDGQLELLAEGRCGGACCALLETDAGLVVNSIESNDPEPDTNKLELIKVDGTFTELNMVDPSAALEELAAHGNTLVALALDWNADPEPVWVVFAGDPETGLEREFALPDRGVADTIFTDGKSIYVLLTLQASGGPDEVDGLECLSRAVDSAKDDDWQGCPGFPNLIQDRWDGPYGMSASVVSSGDDWMLSVSTWVDQGEERRVYTAHEGIWTRRGGLPPRMDVRAHFATDTGFLIGQMANTTEFPLVFFVPKDPTLAVQVASVGLPNDNARVDRFHQAADGVVVSVSPDLYEDPAHPKYYLNPGL